MTQENEPVLSKISEDFGTGKFVSWEDGETKQVLITNWGQYVKKTDDGNKIAFRAAVLNMNGREYLLGDKIIDTTSMAFHKEIKPYVLDADKLKQMVLNLEITRKGDKMKTTYFIKLLALPKARGA